MKNYSQKLKIYTTLFFFLILTLALFTFNLGKAHAQDVLPLVVSPARQELTVNPGEKATVTIRFLNQSASPRAGIIKAVDFIVQDKEGTPTFLEKAGDVSPKFSAASWVKLPYDRAAIPANDKIEFQASISAPKEARPGGRYLAIYFEPTTQIPAADKKNTEGGVGVSSRIVSLVYIRVAGPITENAHITRFFAPNFLEYGPVKVVTEVFNQGDYHIHPKGTITLSNMFGEIAQDTIKEQNIFPDTTRSFETELGPKWMIGRYKIATTLSYGEKGQVLERSIYVWAFPWKVALIAVFSLVILILIIRAFIRRVGGGKDDELEAEVKAEKQEIEKLKAELEAKGRE